MRRKIFLMMAGLLAAYLLVLYTFQEKFYFWPTKGYRPPTEAGFPFYEKALTMADGTIGMVWYAEGRKEMPSILFLHGNAYQLEKFAPLLMPYVDKGYSVYMLEYRGFGGVAGKPSQENMFSDATVVFDWIKSRSETPVVVYGYSFGCAVAMGLTLHRTPDAVILQAPFASLKQLVKEKPVPFASYLLKAPFASDKAVQHYTNPLLIVHGTQDTLIPVHHAQVLFHLSGSPDKTFVPFDGKGHRFFFDGTAMPTIEKWIDNRFKKGGA